MNELITVFPLDYITNTNIFDLNQGNLEEAVDERARLDATRAEYRCTMHCSEDQPVERDSQSNHVEVGESHRKESETIQNVTEDDKRNTCDPPKDSPSQATNEPHQNIELECSNGPEERVRDLEREVEYDESCTDAQFKDRRGDCDGVDEP